MSLWITVYSVLKFFLGNTDLKKKNDVAKRVNRFRVFLPDFTKHLGSVHIT